MFVEGLLVTVQLLSFSFFYQSYLFLLLFPLFPFFDVFDIWAKENLSHCLYSSLSYTTLFVGRASVSSVFTTLLFGAMAGNSLG